MRHPATADGLIAEIVQRLREIDACDESWSGIYGRAASRIESEFVGHYSGCLLVREDRFLLRLGEVMYAESPRLLDDRGNRESWNEFRARCPGAWEYIYGKAQAALTAAQEDAAHG